MYLTSGAKVRTRRSRSARSFVRRYSRQSARESSEDILRAARLGAVASVMLVLLQSRGTGRGGVSATGPGPFNGWTPRRPDHPHFWVSDGPSQDFHTRADEREHG